MEGRVSALEKEYKGSTQDIPKVLKALSYIPDKLSQITSWGLEKTVGPFEKIFYKTEFDRAMGTYITKVGKEASAFLTKDNISNENRYKRDKLIQQWKREARDSVKTAFYDYSNNPLIINKLETYIPFTNFMYNGIKNLAKYPKTFLFGASMLNNLQYTNGQPVYYVDEEGQRIDEGQSLRIPLLAAFGLDNVALNMNRMLQVSPGAIGFKPASWYNLITGKEDPRFNKFYKSGSVADFMDIGISMMSPSLSKGINAILNFTICLIPKLIIFRNS